MSTNDYGMLFEKTVEAYWGNPKTSIYFSNYWGNKFEMRAILFSIILQEINFNPSNYDANKLEFLKEYARKSSDGKTSHTENVNVLKLLAEFKSLT